MDPPVWEIPPVPPLDDPSWGELERELATARRLGFEMGLEEGYLAGLAAGKRRYSSWGSDDGTVN